MNKKLFSSPTVMVGFPNIPVPESGGFVVQSADIEPITLPDGTDVVVDNQGIILE